MLRHVPQERLIFDDGDANRSTVRAGLGIRWAPMWIGLDDLRMGDAVEILRDWEVQETSLPTNRLSQRLTPAFTEAVQDFLVKVTAKG